MAIYKTIEEKINGLEPGSTVYVTGQIMAKRKHGTCSFLDLVDASGHIQIVVDSSLPGYEELIKLNRGSFVQINGTLQSGRKALEILADNAEIISPALVTLEPSPWRIDGMDTRYQEAVIGTPSFYHSNPQRMAALRVYTTLRQAFHRYFQTNGYLEVVPPVMTASTIYGRDLAVKAEVNGENIFLTQCSTFELEPLAMAHGNVYTIAPAFRNESAGTKRHLNEYYHLKAESLLATLDDLMALAGDAIYCTVSDMAGLCQKELDLLHAKIDLVSLNPQNFERLTYKEARDVVNGLGSDLPFGKDLSISDEHKLIDHLGGNKYVWIIHKPAESEGFPYRLHPDDPTLTLTGDLIAPHKAGEMVGIAEKIYNAEELVDRIRAKGFDPNDYLEYIHLRNLGMPPHGGLGAAPERIAYGLMDLPHINCVMPYPRYPGRRIRGNFQAPNT
ncbi:MAG: asparagine--tRNA ligase [archaeon]